MQRALARFGLRAYACFTRAMRMRVTKALGLSSWSCLFACWESAVSHACLCQRSNHLESTRIRICLIDRLLYFKLASGKVRLDVPAKPYDNVEQARLGDEHLKFFIQNMKFPALLYFTSGKSHRSSGNIRHIIDSLTGFGRATETFLERPQPT